MTTQEFTDLLEYGGADIRDDYSGRGMYGKTCVGFTASNLGEAIEVFADALESCEGDQRADFVKEFKRVQTDGMGLDTIFYFSRMTTGFSEN